ENGLKIGGLPVVSARAARQPTEHLPGGADVQLDGLCADRLAGLDNLPAVGLPVVDAPGAGGFGAPEVDQPDELPFDNFSQRHVRDGSLMRQHSANVAVVTCLAL